MGDATWRKGYRRTAETCEVVVARAQSGTLMGVAGFSYTAVEDGGVAFGGSRRDLGLKRSVQGVGARGRAPFEKGGCHGVVRYGVQGRRITV